MTGKDVFKIWAPLGEKWTEWVRPVPFVAITEEFKAYKFNEFTIPEINYLEENIENTAIIIDLPGCDSVKEAIGVANCGFRPIPIYNGTIEQKGALPTVNNQDIIYGLIFGASKLQNIKLEKEAPPAFLLDSNRMHRFKMNLSVFDNSWDIYPQDIPSKEYFIQNGINKIIIRSEEIRIDLNKILYDYQNAGIKIFFTNGYEKPKEIKIKKIKDRMDN